MYPTAHKSFVLETSVDQLGKQGKENLYTGERRWSATSRFLGTVYIKPIINGM